jgi:hypothetical protein
MNFINYKVGKNYPENPSINGVGLVNRSLEFSLNCKIKNPRSPKVYSWRIIPQKSDRDGDQLLQDHLGLGGSPDENKFRIQFEKFSIAHTDLVEIKVILFDETDTVKAYHYVSLKHLYQACKKGKDIWLCMGINDQEKTKFPLLHLRATSYLPDKKPSPSIVRTELKMYDRNHIEDTFFTCKFKFPPITPKHVKFLELLPADWKILDEKTKSL